MNYHKQTQNTKHKTHTKQIQKTDDGVYITFETNLYRAQINAMFKKSKAMYNEEYMKETIKSNQILLLEYI